MACKCHNCGNKYKMDLIVSNELWIKINPSKNIEGGLLCPPCIVKALEKLKGYSSYTLLEIGIEDDKPNIKQKQP